MTEFDQNGFGIARGDAAIGDFHRVAVTNPIVHRLYTLFRLREMDYTTMLINCVVHLAKQNEELSKSLADAISNRPTPTIIVTDEEHCVSLKQKVAQWQKDLFN